MNPVNMGLQFDMGVEAGFRFVIGRVNDVLDGKDVEIGNAELDTLLRRIKNLTEQRAFQGESNVSWKE